MMQPASVGQLTEPLTQPVHHVAAHATVQSDIYRPYKFFFSFFFFEKRERVIDHTYTKYTRHIREE